MSAPFTIKHLISLDAQATPDTFCSGHGTTCLENSDPVAYFETIIARGFSLGFRDGHVHNRGRGGAGPHWGGRHQMDLSYGLGALTREGPPNYLLRRSKQATNKGHLLAESAWWEDGNTPGAHSMLTSYTLDAVVSSSGSVFVSLQNGNLGHAPPATEDTWWRRVDPSFTRGIVRRDEIYARGNIMCTWYYQPRYCVSKIANNTGRCPISDSAAWDLTWASVGVVGGESNAQVWNKDTTYAAGTKLVLPFSVFRKSRVSNNHGRAFLIGIADSDTIIGNGYWLANEGIGMVFEAPWLHRSDGGAYLLGPTAKAIAKAKRGRYADFSCYLGACNSVRITALLASGSLKDRQTALAIIQFVEEDFMQLEATQVFWDGSNFPGVNTWQYGKMCQWRGMGLRMGVEAWPNRWDTPDGIWHNGDPQPARMSHLHDFDIYVPGQSILALDTGAREADAQGHYQNARLTDLGAGVRILVNLDYQPGVDRSPGDFDYIAGATFNNTKVWFSQWATIMRTRGYSIATTIDWMDTGELSDYSPSGYVP